MGLFVGWRQELRTNQGEAKLFQGIDCDIPVKCEWKRGIVSKYFCIFFALSLFEYEGRYLLMVSYVEDQRKAECISISDSQSPV